MTQDKAQTQADPPDEVDRLLRLARKIKAGAVIAVPSLVVAELVDIAKMCGASPDETAEFDNQPRVAKPTLTYAGEPLSVRCPKCQALAGEPCTSMTGRKMLDAKANIFHSQRWDRARELGPDQQVASIEGDLTGGASCPR